ncbi:MAG: adenylosuccinate synthetase [Candidatus Kerfeldbacteria bacterium]|nr:adenylosuccinate synthetase [Candidatus Kerfeldbacteria bacterium]
MPGQRATIVADVGFGDAGKGATVDFLARSRQIAAVVRFNGGGQAAHNVVIPNGIHHTYAQFGSATFIPGVRTHLSRFMLLDPVTLMTEAKHLRDSGCGNPFDRLTVDGQALVVTPFHKAGNRLREVARGPACHGSCGMGIGEAVADRIADPNAAVFVHDLKDRSTLARKLQRQHEAKRQLLAHFHGLASDPRVEKEVALLNNPDAAIEWATVFNELSHVIPVVSGEYLHTLAQAGELIFEGAQGMLIDEWHGFHPYTTWSTTTFANALTLLREIGYAAPIERLGVVRAYFVRHGAGPFPTEMPELSPLLPDSYNGHGRWQGAFRVGWFDRVLARYALTVSGGADALAVTHLDQFTRLSAPRVGVAYDVPAAVAFRDRHVAVFRGSEKGGFVRTSELRPKAELTDLSHQEALTALLAVARPVYETAPTDVHEYLAMLERGLGVPVTLTACGPTAADRRFVTAASCSFVR